jgi:hypothetical protein
VASALTNQAWIPDITGALTIPVIVQYIEIRQRLLNVQANSEITDTYWWRWVPSGAYSCHSAYKIMFVGQTAILGAPQLWKSRAPNKCRFFMWTLLLSRCWTAERRHRHGLSSSANCSLCSQELEHIDHLFLQCAFSREVWFKVLRRCGWHHFAPDPFDCLVDWWLTSKKLVTKPRHRALDSMVISVCWSIWLQRNERLFSREISDPTSVAGSSWNMLAMWARASLVDWSRLVNE